MKIREEVYNTYWYVAAERQSIFFKKLQGEQPPYSDDPIFQTYKFCNTYRASDRVSQYLIRNVIYKKSDYTNKDQLFRILLFRLLNSDQTWQSLENELEDITFGSYSFRNYDSVFEKIRQQNGRLYGNAFILCANSAFGFSRKHQNHLALLEEIFKTNMGSRILEAKSLKELFATLLELPLIGNFMAYQIAIDLNYSELFNFSENDFTFPGPGAIRGIKKCFTGLGQNSPQQVIMHMVENQEKEFERLGIKFQSLFGRRLHAIDCQGLFCETDKYSRAKFPELKSNRSRIKAKYKASSKTIDYFYPPKWGLKVTS